MILANQDGSVMVYLVENGTVEVRVPAVTRTSGGPVYTTEIKPAYDMYIQANGKVYANYDSSFWFAFLINLTEINNIENLDTSYVTNMSGLFCYSGSLVNLDVSHFDTSNVTNMMDMFANAFSLATLDVSHFDTSNVTDMNEMFYGADSLTTLDLSNFDTSNVTDMSSMFSGDKALTSIIYGSKFIHANNAYVDYMFKSCPANRPTDPSWEGLDLD